ncbi:MAG: hypothetical protein P4N41_14555 [Negativicutes bacterium]|nr:hypothetical protein [Negativicutes bacterium]
MMYYLSIGLTIVSNLLYHLFQKSTPSNVSPLASLAVSYAIALFLCLVSLAFFAKGNVVETFKELNWTSYALGFAILGIELGWLLAYRAGWNISIGSTFSNVAVGLLLLPIGLVFMKETITVPNIAGLLFCAVGLFLISLRG